MVRCSMVRAFKVRVFKGEVVQWLRCLGVRAFKG